MANETTKSTFLGPGGALEGWLNSLSEVERRRTLVALANLGTIVDEAQDFEPGQLERLLEDVRHREGR